MNRYVIEPLLHGFRNFFTVRQLHGIFLGRQHDRIRIRCEQRFQPPHIAEPVSVVIVESQFGHHVEAFPQVFQQRNGIGDADIAITGSPSRTFPTARSANNGVISPCRILVK